MYKTQIETVLTLDTHARHCFVGCFAIDELESLTSHLPTPPPPPPPQHATLSRTAAAAAAAMTKGQLQKRQHRRRRWQRRPQLYDGFQARTSSRSRSSSSSQDRAYVINYDESNEPGSHWVVVYDSLSSSSSSSSSPEFFDPAGLPPLDDRIKVYLLGPDYTYNPNVLQQVQGNACGFYCVYYILQRSRNVSADDIVEFLASLSSSSDVVGSSQSDFFVKDFIYSQFKPVFN